MAARIPDVSDSMREKKNNLCLAMVFNMNSAHPCCQNCAASGQNKICV
jgi:hypothetical protein